MTRREKQWIQSIQDGDKQACHAFVSQYLPSLFAFFRGMGLSAAMAEDLAQETFLEIWKSLASFRGDSSLKTWVFVIGRRVAWRQMKRHRREEPQDELQDERTTADEAAPRQDELVWRREQKALLDESIHELATSYREVLLLHYMEELSIREVSLVLDIAEGTVKSRLHRALSQLRGKIESYGAPRAAR